MGERKANTIPELRVLKDKPYLSYIIYVVKLQRPAKAESA